MLDRKYPVGKLSSDFDGLQKAGCIQCEHDTLKPLFTALMAETNGNPCHGCPKWDSDGPKCPAFQKYHSAATSKASRSPGKPPATQPSVNNGQQYANKTVAQIAASLGISKSEVRRRKAAGTL